MLHNLICVRGNIPQEKKENLAKLIVDEITGFITDFYKEDIENEKRKNTLDKRKN